MTSEPADRSPTLLTRLRQLVVGRARSPRDPHVFTSLSLIALFAWVGLGSDGLSSSCYGPEEAFRVLHDYPGLGIFVALASAVTVFIICASYSQIIELFPAGGGGYVVASKLLAPGLGMISGCALILDYVLTIAISIASGADAIFSFLPKDLMGYKMHAAVGAILLLSVMNMRGVRESVTVLAPIFMVFLVTHVLIVLYSVFDPSTQVLGIVSDVRDDVQRCSSTLGLGGMLVLILRAYSMGAGTYTGLEAVSNGLPVLREPRVRTAKRVMIYMAISLSFIVLGLIVSYMLYHLRPVEGKTLNAVLIERIAQDWTPELVRPFIIVTLFSEAALLFVAAQTGFVGGPQVLSNMALDRWMPTRFMLLSDRLVTQNGILLMGTAAVATILLTGGSVHLLVTLYGIFVFISFVLSQAGMVKYCLTHRDNTPLWRKRLLVNGFALVINTFLLVSLVIFKFFSGGWITLLVVIGMVLLSLSIKRHYRQTAKLLRRLDSLVQATEATANLSAEQESPAAPVHDPNAKTAVFLVNGFNGLGLHTLFGVIRHFGNTFKNFVFIHVGVIDAGNFKGASEVEKLQAHVQQEVQRYVTYMQSQGYYAEGYSSICADVVTELADMAPRIVEKYPQAVFFGGQLVFPKESFFSRWLHNYIVFAVQRRFHHQGIPFLILPIRV
ncbi:MAG: APC family permease [Lentisphaerae bacterium]|nr:APC family permease [Lentisphaerota bacterium]